MPAPPPKTANVAAEPRFELATMSLLPFFGDTPRFEPGKLHAAKKAASVRIANPPRTFFVYDFIVVYLLV
jgi:hypothetical protein